MTIRANGSDTGAKTGRSTNTGMFRQFKEIDVFDTKAFKDDLLETQNIRINQKMCIICPL